jgi:hypothetical protein
MNHVVIAIFHGENVEQLGEIILFGDFFKILHCNRFFADKQNSEHLSLLDLFS